MREREEMGVQYVNIMLGWEKKKGLGEPATQLQVKTLN